MQRCPRTREDVDLADTDAVDLGAVGVEEAIGAVAADRQGGQVGRQTNMTSALLSDLIY